MKKFQAWAAMACVMGCALAQPALAGGFVDGYVTAKSDFDGSLGTTKLDDDGTGFGLRGQFGISESWSVIGEYARSNYDSFDSNLTQVRIGVGQLDANGAGYSFEYASLDVDAETLRGPGAHLRLRSDIGKDFWVHGGLGALLLKGKESGTQPPTLELNLGGGYKIQKNLGAFLDIRNTYIGGSQDEGDLRGSLIDIRAGARLDF